ncbi:PKD domain-containing protein [Dyadobacter aurulentus]|uniref:PKD domain-containing protein n=1 Tax=Dyadobacter sp. UC 10 TaxID=2605428 RepID=UPI0011F27105|nr:PKD domain-containing protein [Dyadobacter sp. UC 10]KAA0992229.1 PKD domain-containing protein [Dyadobacter sp. UC 10]
MFRFDLAAMVFLLFSGVSASGETILRKAKATLTPVEMNKEDTLKFTLRNGETRTMVLKEISSDVIITNLGKLREDQPGGATLYHFTCQVLIDGHLMKMERYVGSQESFYEPYVINGMRIWFDGVKTIGQIIKDEHGGKSSESVPRKHARFVVTDMTNRIAPSRLYPMFPNSENFLRISNSYNGDDCWLGAYNGFELHGGLDLNNPAGTPHFTPFPIDDHYFVFSLDKGDNNNRWRGIHTWENGDKWSIQNHHMLNLRIPEHKPIGAGVYYSDGSGVHVGNNTHSHFVFRVKTMENETEVLLDPWILFWQTFEDNRERAGETKAIIGPFRPGKAGERVSFIGEKSRNEYKNVGRELLYYWTFGDGGIAIEKNPKHVFVKPGIYPVTLLVDDGVTRSSFTQHIAIDGRAIGSPGRNSALKTTPALALACSEEPSFRIRPAHVMDVYALERKFIPNTLHFLARPTRPQPNAKMVALMNVGKGVLGKVNAPTIEYLSGTGWLDWQTEGQGNDQKLKISVNATNLTTGVYSARIRVEVPGSVNAVQYLMVNLTVPTYPPAHNEIGNLKREIVDNADLRENRFYSTPYFWIAPQFKRWKEKGFGDLYLTNGGRATEGEFVRFRPDLAAGTYELLFSEQTPFDPQLRATANGKKFPVDSKLNAVPRFKVRVHSKNGGEEIWVEPTESLSIGKFEFLEGMDGYVDIVSEGSEGQVLVDAIIFKRVEK